MNNNPPAKQFTPEQRNLLCLAYERHKGKARGTMNVQEEFRLKYPESKVPLQSTIYRIWQKQNRVFTVHNLNSKSSPGETFSGRPRSAITPENIQAVQDMLDRDCEKEYDDPSINSCRRNELGIDRSTMSRIIKQHLHYHCYKMIKCQALLDTDLDRRRRFATYILNNLTEEDMLNTAFSDEATFTMDGMINSQNVRRYAPKKVRGGDEGGRPKNFRYKTSKFPAKVMVFLGVHGSGNTWGLKLYRNETIDGDEYHRLLRYTAIPALKVINGGTLDGMYWQQDGAKVHRTKKVLQYLDGQFGPRMLALDSIRGVEWPPRSPDLNPLDFFVW